MQPDYPADDLREIFMKRFIVLAVVMLMPVLTSACNTMAGAGEDISAGGQKLEKSADEHKGRDIVDQSLTQCAAAELAGLQRIK